MSFSVKTGSCGVVTPQASRERAATINISLVITNFIRFGRQRVHRIQQQLFQNIITARADYASVLLSYAPPRVIRNAADAVKLDSFELLIESSSAR